MSGIQFAIWALARRLANKTGTLRYSGRGLAKLFRPSLDKDSVYRAVKALTADGWFCMVSGSVFNSSMGKRVPTTFKILSHDEWQAAHPEGCALLAAEKEVVATADPDSVVSQTGRTCRPDRTNMSASGDKPVGVEGHKADSNRIGSKAEAEPAAAASPSLLPSGQNPGTAQKKPGVGVGGQPKKVVAETGRPPNPQHPNLAALIEAVQSRVPKVKLVECQLDAAAIAVLDEFSVEQLMAAWDWACAWEDTFWTTRGIAPVPNAVMNLLHSFPRICDQRADAQKPKAKAKGAHLKANCQPDPAKPPYPFMSVQA
jgi:hypothetical protein